MNPRLQQCAVQGVFDLCRRVRLGCSVIFCSGVADPLLLLLCLPLMCLEANDLELGGAVTSAHAQNVLYCIGSDFMEVKQLATTLIRQLPSCTMGLQVHI